jgi:hypothetical protein
MFNVRCLSLVGPVGAPAAPVFVDAVAVQGIRA